MLCVLRYVQEIKEYWFNVFSQDVAQAQRALDPAGVAERRTGRLHRRAYTSMVSVVISFILYHGLDP